MKLTQIDTLEAWAVDIVAKTAPWLAPLPTAYLIGQAAVEHLSWPVWVGVVAAIIIESLGLATTATALELRAWNARKRKADPSAPAQLAFGLVGLYFLTAIGLTVVLDIFPPLTTYAPAIFPLLSLAGVTVLALRSDHRLRLEAVKTEKEARTANRQADVKVSSVKVSNSETQDKPHVDTSAKKQRQLELFLNSYRENPTMGVTEAARITGVSRQTVYNWLDELETAGRIYRNGQGVDVLK